MPYGDGTGPHGTGPVGRRRGPCCADAPARGRRQCTPDEERTALQADKAHVEMMLKRINERLEALTH